MTRVFMKDAENTLQVVEAKGTDLCPEEFVIHDAFSIDPTADSFEEKTGCRLISGADPVRNTRALNQALEIASLRSGGGTVLVPEGEYPVYTIRLLSHVTLHLCKGAVLRAARPLKSCEGALYEGQYDEPEVNLFAGLQDHGHTYFANSLVYGADLEDICISGPGRLDGCFFAQTQAKSACQKDDKGRMDRADRVQNVPKSEWILQTGDPWGPKDRAKPGHLGEWFGNKCIALVRCRRVLLTQFSVLYGGHFAVIAAGCDDLYAQELLIDTNRDAFDIDACQNVTVRNCVFNSINDDALCLKSSCGFGRIRPVRNVLIEDCCVLGYDCGSVYAGTRTETVMTAPDGCGPTGRVKFGTEASGGCDTVTVRRVHFERSRGFCLEACDGAPMHDILLEDCSMENISSSPVFLRVGDRARTPVTGLHADTQLRHEQEVRLDHPEWVLPNCPELPKFPARRYTPSYRRDRRVDLADGSSVDIVSGSSPCRINPALFAGVESLAEGKDGTVYFGEASCEDAANRDEKMFVLKRWDEQSASYVPDENTLVSRKELPLYANAVGTADFAAAWNIVIRRLTVRGADARYPILIHGLDDSEIRNVLLEEIDAQFLGGLGPGDACAQRQFNPFFCKAEAQLPRADWDAAAGCWVPDPYNVPEMPQEYPEPSAWGVLPSFGLYVRHARDLTIRSVHIRTRMPDLRPGAVFDDVSGLELEDIKLCGDGDLESSHAVWAETNGPQPGNLVQTQGDPAGLIRGRIVFVHALYRRPTGLEYVPEYPYHETSVGVKKPVPEAVTVRVAAPAPGTPKDSLYPHETCPCLETGFV